MLIDTYVQQPADKLDYDIPYSVATGDSLQSVTAVVTPSVGLTVDALVIAGNKVKLWAYNGTAGQYKVDVTVTTTLGRIKQDEVKFRVREY